MDKLFERLPEIITAAAQSYLGTLALLSLALSVLAYFFFAKASEKARLGIFVLLFLGVLGFGAALFQVSDGAPVKSLSSAKTDPLSKEAKTLLKEAALDPSGLVLFEHFGGGVDLQTNQKSMFPLPAEHQTLALWEAALQELVKEGLLVVRDKQGEVFEITKKGYDVAKQESR